MSRTIEGLGAKLLRVLADELDGDSKVDLNCGAELDREELAALHIKLKRARSEAREATAHREEAVAENERIATVNDRLARELQASRKDLAELLTAARAVIAMGSGGPIEALREVIARIDKG